MYELLTLIDTLSKKIIMPSNIASNRGLIYLVLIVVAEFLSGCTAGLLEYEFPFVDDKLAVNGLIDTTGARLSLRRPINPNDTVYYDQAYALENARVRIGIPGRPQPFIDTVVGGGSAEYFFPLAIALNDTLEISVEAEGFPVATVDEVTIPDTFSTFTVEVIDVDIFEGFGEFSYRIPISLTYTVPPDQQPEAFIVSMPDAGVRGLSNPGFLSDLDEDINTNCGVSRGRWMSWSSRCFANNESTTLPLTIRFTTSRMINTLTLELASVQEALNEHLVSLYQGNDTFDRLFVESNATNFNVNGGFGVVSGKFARRITIEL